MAFILKNASVINEGQILHKDILVEGKLITKIERDITHPSAKVLDLAGKYVIPGIIDDQVHFREPGLTHKANIYTESRAAVAGGVTSFMEMPNVNPPSVTQERLAQKYQIGAATSLANYSFFMGTTNENLEEVLRTNPEDVCGVKIFMGSSTGNMLVDNEKILRSLFSQVPMLIAAHCEDEAIIRANLAAFKERYGENVPASLHPIIRNREACYKSSSFAISLAKEYGTRFHVLHISTAEECALFNNDLPLAEKKITAEACVHHLSFQQEDYARLGNLIKCNPAIKEQRDKEAILQALLDDRIDIIATDHAPHTWEEKAQTYFKSPSGLPLVQHSLQLMLKLFKEGKITLEKMVEKMCHAPAECFRIKERGYIREGYYADLAVVEIDSTSIIHNKDVLYKCGWTPLDGMELPGAIIHTFVNGHLAYENGIFDESVKGMRLKFRV